MLRNKSSLIARIALPLLALIGFGDATYLTVEHFLNALPTCTITGCETVLTSQYATIFGIPVALLGALYYLTILVLSVLYHQRRQRRIWQVLMILTTLGFLMTIRFVVLQLWVLDAICIYCMASAAASTLVWLITISLWHDHPTISSTDSSSSSPASPTAA